MSNSPLVTYTRISPNRSSPRTRTVDRMTIHCYVGQVTAEQGCSGSRFVYRPVCPGVRPGLVQLQSLQRQPGDYHRNGQ